MLKYKAFFCKEGDAPEHVDQLLQFRKRVFIDSYKWQLEEFNGRERDAFDTAFTIHCGLFKDDELVGTFRANRTDQPYLSAWVFGALAKDQHFPRQPTIWEISRFAVLSKGEAQRYSYLNYGLMFYFARQLGVTSLVATADETYERYLSLLGIKTKRYGNPQIIGTTQDGNPVSALAGEIPIASQKGSRFERLLQSLKNVEIEDVSNVFGPVRISA
jgi:N-acyl-L-homoserine lactone synthetase